MRNVAELLNKRAVAPITGRVFASLVVALALTTACGEEAGVDTDAGATADTATGGGDTALGTEDASLVDTGTGTDAATLDLGADTGGTDAAGETTTGDADTGTTDADAAVNPCPGGAGCSCQQNSDCTDSQKCIATPKGLKCAKLCSTSACGADEKCISSGGGEPVDICVPKWGSVCNPCNSNQECEKLDPGARCVDQGENGAFCGSSCKVDGDCPSGYECKDTKDVAGASSTQCVVKGAAACTCSEYAIALELATSCFKQAGTAKCQGKRTCLADGKPNAPKGGGLSSCYAPDPTPEQCDGKDNDCNGQTDEATCIDNKVCTDDNCKGGAGCDNPAKSGVCDADGTVCTKDDQCVNGECKSGAVQICDDKNDCTKDSCDPKDGCKYAPDEGKSCNADDNPCTVNDACDKTGKCVSGPDKACTSSDQCTKGKCEPTGSNPGACKYTFQATFPCNDGNACTDVDKCDQGKGDCVGTVKTCDDQKPCTADSCDPLKDCQHSPTLTTPCNDDDACTTKDTCDKGVCVGVTLDPTKPKGIGGCNDENPCTTDLCNPAIGCQNKPDNQDKCDDGNPCTQGDICSVGTCKAGTNICACTADSDCKSKEDGNLCNGTLYCDKSAAPYQCKVNPVTIVECSTANDGQCKATTCDPANGQCVTVNKTNGQDCDADKTVCTDKDACADGKCVVGKIIVCDDKNPCTKDSCDAIKGCVFDYNTDPCNADDSACTVGDICKGGSCIAGSKKVCDDNEECTKDSCTAADGKCVYDALTTPCEDGNNCTIGDKCGGGKCVAGAGPTCDDSNPCTADTCDSKTGCVNKADDTIKVQGCYSGDPATKGKGTCKPGYQACAAGKIDSKCQGEVVPTAKELCDGVDDTCNGTTDEGCKPTAFSARMGSATVSGKGQAYAARAFVGGSQVVGESVGQKYTAKFGFYAWIKAVLGL